MGKNVWHKRYHGDALNGCMGLTLEERGAYATILDLMYDTDWEIGIADRERWIAGHMNVSVRKWKTLRDSLIAAGKIDIVDGMISNFRYRKERENALEISRKRAESGASGGLKSGEVRAKAAENCETDEANASILPLYARATEAEAEAEVEVMSKYSSQRAKRGTRLHEDWKPARPYPENVQALVNQWPPGRERREFDGFRDYWLSRTANATKIDWDKTWHNRIRDQHDRVMAQSGNRNGRYETEPRDGVIRALDRQLGLEQPSGASERRDDGNGSDDSGWSIAGPSTMF